MFDMPVMSNSGVIVTPPEVPVRNVLLLATVAPGIERPVMQAQELLTCRPSKSRESLPLFSLSASSPAPTLPWDSAKYSSSSFSLDRFQPLCMLFGAAVGAPGGIDVSQMLYACVMIVCIDAPGVLGVRYMYVCKHACMYYV